MADVLTLDEAIAYRAELAARNKKLVITNGCFDILHRGHASYLAEARKLGDALLVLVNSDASVRALKGPSRPVNGEADRAYLLTQLKAVDKAMIFDGARCDKELAALAPDIYTKAGDYTLDKLDAAERAALEKNHVEIVFMPFVDGFSTTKVIEKMKR